MGKLENKVAIVTGAGRGIGRGIAEKLAAEGATVVVTDIDQQSAETTAKELGGGAIGLRVDVTSRESVAEMVTAVTEKLGRIDVLVNNAGWDKVGPFVDSDEADWDRVIAINLYGVLNTSKAVLPIMAAQGHGHVVNLGSDAGRVGSSGEAVYSAAKGGVIAFTKAIAREMARNQVNVNCICPGPTDTPLFASIGGDNPKLRDALTKAIPFRRLADPSDLANAVAFFASDEAALHHRPDRQRQRRPHDELTRHAMTFDTILTEETIDEYTSSGLLLQPHHHRLPRRRCRPHPGQDGGDRLRRQVTYRELQAETDRCALGLLELGVRSGRRRVVPAAELDRVPGPAFRCHPDRCCQQPADPDLPGPRGRLHGRVRRSPRSWWCRGSSATSTTRRWSDRLRPTWPALQHVFVVDGQPGDANPSWESFMATPWEQRRDPAELATVRPDPNEVTLLMFTSGTTGEPKGVMHTHNSLVAAIEPLPERLGVNSDSVIHMASTLSHLTGLLYGARLQTQIGATGVYQDVWNNERFVELIEQHRITHTSAATPFLHDTLNAPNIDAHDVSSLVRFCCFGAPIPPAIVRQARQRWPELAVISGWGQTEDALVTLGIPGDPEEKVVDRAGYPCPGCRSGSSTSSAPCCPPTPTAGCRSPGRSCSPATPSGWT